MKKYLIYTLLACASFSCTENQRAKSYGGSMTVDLPANTKLMNVTWKNEQLWYLTRPLRENENPETSTFSEKSDLGLVEGQVIFKESK
jgi:hypothetical protein